MKNKFFLIALIVVILFAGAFLAISKNFKSTDANLSANQVQPANTSSSFQVTPIGSNLLIKAHAPIKGNVNAKITIVEFLDPECEACSASYLFVKKILQEFSTDVRFIVRYSLSTRIQNIQPIFLRVLALKESIGKLLSCYLQNKTNGQIIIILTLT